MNEGNKLVGSLVNPILRGYSAYELAAKQYGFPGTEEEWLASLRYDHSDEFESLKETIERDLLEAKDTLEEIKTNIETYDNILKKTEEYAKTAETEATRSKESADNAETSNQNALELVNEFESTVNNKTIESTNTVDAAKNQAIREIEDEMASLQNYASKFTTDLTNEKTRAMNAEKVITDKSASSISLDLDENYIMTVALHNSNGLTIDTKRVDLPIENMVVDASYSDGEITMVLQNGRKIVFSVSELVRGLVTEEKFNNDLTNAVNDLNEKIAKCASKVSVDEIQTSVNSLEVRVDALEDARLVGVEVDSNGNATIISSVITNVLVDENGNAVFSKRG